LNEKTGTDTTQIFKSKLLTVDLGLLGQLSPPAAKNLQNLTLAESSKHCGKAK
jgi:hypothetical protein